MEYTITTQTQQGLASAIGALCLNDEQRFEATLIEIGLYDEAGEPKEELDVAAGWVLGHALSLPNTPTFNQLLDLTANTFLYLEMDTVEKILQMAQTGQLSDIDTTAEELFLTSLAILAINWLTTQSLAGLVQPTDIKITVESS